MRLILCILLLKSSLVGAATSDQEGFATPNVGGFKVDEKAAATYKTKEQAYIESQSKVKELVEKEKQQKAVILKSRRGTRICAKYTSHTEDVIGNIEEIAGENLKILSTNGKAFWDSADRWYVCNQT